MANLSDWWPGVTRNCDRCGQPFKTSRHTTCRACRRWLNKTTRQFTEVAQKFALATRDPIVKAQLVLELGGEEEFEATLIEITKTMREMHSTIEEVLAERKRRKEQPH
jgi:hypothetical protein